MDNEKRSGYRVNICIWRAVLQKVCIELLVQKHMGIQALLVVRFRYLL